jgi:Tfp pilus assembly protein PilN
MSSGTGQLILDFSEEFISLYCKGYTYISDTSVEQFFLDTENAIKKFLQEVEDKDFGCNELIVTLPLVCLNHQILTLPDNVSDKEKMLFLGLEINRPLIGKRFGVQRLDVTQRDEGQQRLCDYIVFSAKKDVYKKIENFALALDLKLSAIVPNIYLLGAEPVNELRASAWVGHDRTEIVIWGKNFPMALAYFPNTGDQIGDINRFIVSYFDHVDNLNLSKVYLFGPRMQDSALGFGLTYPHQILENPVRYIINNLQRAPQGLNIVKEIKLPQPPIPMTPRNIIFLASAVAIALMIFVTGTLQATNFRARARLNNLERQSARHRKILNEFKKLKQSELELNSQLEFFLDITKRRTPWNKILTDLSKLTPKEVWFDRFSGDRTKILIIGKARSAEDVSSLSINLNNNSEFVKDALILGTRDYEENNQKYSEFQIAAKLKSPTGKFAETNRNQETGINTKPTRKLKQ